MAKKSKKFVVSQRPIGVTILAVLAYIGAVFSLLAGIAMLFGSAIIGPILNKIPEYAMAATWGPIAFILLGLFLIACAVLDYFIGKGLWNGKNWARILVLVLTSLSALSSLMSFDLVGLVIAGLIIWYLGFNKKTIPYFK